MTDLRDAITHDARLGDRVQVRTALERGVEVLVNVERPDEAAVIHGAVSGDVVIRRFMSGPERARHDAAAARAERELGAPAFARAAADGAGMELDELVAWSIAALDRLLDDAR
jgi:hypothetical protein